MAITFFGSASNPADNGSYATSPVVITPPSSMQAGDLVFVTVCFSGTSGTISVSAAGGQAWSTLTQRNQTRNRANSFWCVFNGTWSADPSWQGSGTSNVIARMLVFRPNGGTAATWVYDYGEVSSTYSAPSSPYTVSNPGTVVTSALAVVVAGWTSADDNTWDSLSDPSSEGWVLVSPNQVRNTYGTYDQSVAHAYLIVAHSGGQGGVSLNQATLGGDAGTRITMAFREVQSPTTVPSPFAVTAEALATVEYGSAVEVPSIIEAVADQPTNTFSIGTTNEQAAISGTFSTADPSSKVVYEVAPDSVDATASQPTPDVFGSGLIEQNAIVGAAALPNPSLSIGTDIPTSPIAGAFSIADDPYESAQVRLVLSEEAVEFSTVDPNMGTGYSGTPLPISARSSQIDPAVSGDAVSVAEPIDAVLDQPVLAAYGESTGEVTVTPDPVEITADQPELGIIGRALIAIGAAIEGLFQTLAPVMAGTLLYVADPVLCAADQPPPTVQAGCVVTPDSITAQSEIIDASSIGSSVVGIQPIAGTFSQAGTPSISVDSIVVVAENAVTASPIDPAPLLGGDVLVPILETADAQASQPTPSTTLVTVFTPEPIEGAFSCLTNDFRIWHVESATPITGDFATLTPTVRPQNKVVGFEWAIPAYLELCAATPKADGLVAVDAIDAEVAPIDPYLEAIVATPQPDHVDATLEQIDPVVTADANYSPSPITAASSILSTTRTAEALVELTILTATGSQPTSIESGRCVTAQDYIAGTFELIDPASVSTAGNVTIVPAPLTGHFTLPIFEADIDRTVVVAPIEGAFVPVDPYVTMASTTATPNAIAATPELIEPTIDTTSAGTPEPTPLVGDLSIASSPSTIVSTTVVVAEISVQATLPTTGFGESKAVAVNHIAGTFSQVTPFVNAAAMSVTASPAPIVGTFAVAYANDTSADAELVPYEIDGVASQPAPSVVITNAPTVAVEPIAGEFVQATPTLIVGGGIALTPEAIAGTFSVVVPTLGESRVVTVDPITAETSLLTPNVAIGDVASITTTPLPITGTFSQPTPTPSGTTSVTVAPVYIEGAASVVAPTVALPKTIAVLNIEGAFSLAEPQFMFNSVTVTPGVITGTVSAQAPLIIAAQVVSPYKLVKDIFRAERIIDTDRELRIAEAPDRDRITDIYLGRK